MDPHHAKHVAAWVDEVFGGRRRTRPRGRRPPAHDLPPPGITEEQRRRWVNLVIDTADEVGLPADPEFRAASPPPRN